MAAHDLARIVEWLLGEDKLRRYRVPRSVKARIPREKRSARKAKHAVYSRRGVRVREFTCANMVGARHGMVRARSRHAIDRYRVQGWRNHLTRSGRQMGPRGG